MRICPNCDIAPLAKFAKLCEGCRKICLKCGKNENKSGQRMCKECHALYMRLSRPQYEDFTEDQKKRARARGLAKYYLKKGLIERRPCVAGDCDNFAEMHHPDPDRPLRIIWACKRHWRRMKLRE
jgi:hypothetical protein